MKQLSLYDLLVGRFESDKNDPLNLPPSLEYFNEQDSSKVYRQSIVENLRKILTTRQKSVAHLPDFGLPDIMDIYLEEGRVEPFIEQVKETIKKYEPRIETVRIPGNRWKFDDKNMRLTLHIEARIKDYDNNETVITEFSSTGWTKVDFEKDMEAQ